MGIIAVLAFFNGVEAKAKPQSVNANVKVSVNGGDQASVTNRTTPYCEAECPPPNECVCWCGEDPAAKINDDLCPEGCPEGTPCACKCIFGSKFKGLHH